MTAQWMCEVGRGKVKKMQLRLIRSPACITGKPREAAAHTGARRALEPALRGPAGAVDGEVARGLQPRRGVGRQAPPSSAGTGTTQESVSKPDLGTRAAHGSVNPPRLHAPRDARTRLWFLFSSYLSAPERLRKPNRTPSPRPGPSPRSRAPARPTLPARTPRRCSARFCPRLRRRRTLLLLPYLRRYSASGRVVPNSDPGSSAEPRGETFSPRLAAARSSPSGLSAGKAASGLGPRQKSSSSGSSRATKDLVRERGGRRGREHFRPASAEAWPSGRLPQPQFLLRRRLGAGPVAAEPAICEWLRWGRRRFWKLLEGAGVAEVTPAARGWGVIKTSARPAAEGLRRGPARARASPGRKPTRP